MNILKMVLVLPVVLLPLAALAASPVKVWNQDDVAGLWWSPDKDSKIEIYRKDGKYYGKLAWMLPKDEGKMDIKNHDPKKRNQKLLGSDIFFDLEFDGKDTWKDGCLYDPRSGNFYQGYLKLEGKDVLSVSGFINFPILGRIGSSKKFKRVNPDDSGTNTPTPAFSGTPTAAPAKAGTPSKPK